MHVHELEWEIGTRRIICIDDACEFVMESRDIMALVRQIAAQQSFAPDAANAPRIVDVLDENGNPQKIAVI